MRFSPIWHACNVIAGLLLCTAPHAAVADGARPLFSDLSAVQVRIEAPLSTFRRERSDVDYLDGTLSYVTTDGENRTLDLKLRARGRFRLMESTCNFPPVRLNFRKKQVEDTLFDGQDKLKLVTHCQHNKPAFEQLLLREYLAYRFFNILTDNSFRVRLMQITWVNTDEADERVRWGFVIEDDDGVADRLGLKAKQTPNLAIEDLEPEQLNLVSVFEYMIGNTDFSVVKGADETDCCHNTVPMSADRSPPYLTVPYDFDLSGLDNAPYATPNPAFNLRTVRQRLYRGRCLNNERLGETLDRFLAAREEMQAVMNELEMLSPRTRRDVSRYLDTFFRDISEAGTRQARLYEKCL